MITMSLDPAVKVVLQAIDSMNLPPFSKMKVEDVRKLMDENPILEPKEDIAHEEDGAVDINGYKRAFRFYDPGQAGNDAIIYIHGGGFVFGTISSSEAVCRRLAKASGSKVISLDYRLGPEHKHPAAIEDCFALYKWIQVNAERFKIDGSRLAVCGDSAGGNLSTMICFRAREEKIPMPKIQVLFYPYIGPDFLSQSQRDFRDGFFLTEDEQLWFADQYLKSPVDIMDPDFSPIMQRDFSNLPETLLITGEYDPLRDQGETFLSKLQAAGVQVTGIRAQGMIHGFASFINVVPAAWSIVTMIGGLTGETLRR